MMIFWTAIINDLFDYNRGIYTEDEFYSSGQLVHHPLALDDAWLDESERRDQQDRICHQREITEEKERSKRLRVPDPISYPMTTDDNDAQVPPLMTMFDSNDHNSDDDDSIAMSDQKGEILATYGLPLVMIAIQQVEILIKSTRTTRNMSVQDVQVKIKREKDL